MTANKQTPVGLARRFAAILYDLLLLLAVLFAASIPVTMILGINYGHPLYPLYIFYIYMLCFLYFGWFWVHGGQTPAMKTWQIRLVETRGSNVSWKQALYRYLAAFISWTALGVGFLWSLIRKDKATWHDLISNTRLIRTE